MSPEDLRYAADCADIRPDFAWYATPKAIREINTLRAFGRPIRDYTKTELMVLLVQMHERYEREIKMLRGPFETLPRP